MLLTIEFRSKKYKLIISRPKLASTWQLRFTIRATYLTQISVVAVATIVAAASMDQLACKCSSKTNTKVYNYERMLCINTISYCPCNNLEYQQITSLLIYIYIYNMVQCSYRSASRYNNSNIYCLYTTQMSCCVTGIVAYCLYTTQMSCCVTGHSSILPVYYTRCSIVTCWLYTTHDAAL